jgi:hypothetical protein
MPQREVEVRVNFEIGTPDHARLGGGVGQSGTISRRESNCSRRSWGGFLAAVCAAFSSARRGKPSRASTSGRCTRLHVRTTPKK